MNKNISKEDTILAKELATAKVSDELIQLTKDTTPVIKINWEVLRTIFLAEAKELSSDDVSYILSLLDIDLDNKEIMLDEFELKTMKSLMRHIGNAYLVHGKAKKTEADLLMLHLEFIEMAKGVSPDIIAIVTSDMDDLEEAGIVLESSKLNEYKFAFVATLEFMKEEITKLTRK